MCDELALLRLMQFTDSALPIGTTAHSFGLESLVAEGLLSPAGFEAYLHDYMKENGALDAAFCRAAHRLPPLNDPRFFQLWVQLNQQIGARKFSRESRDASLTLGRRFTRLSADLLGEVNLLSLSQSNVHHVASFGLVTRRIEVAETQAILAWLHQSAMTQVSAAQRLMALGQNAASAILWRLKALLLEIAHNELSGHCFTPLPEVAAMRHASLTVRLFIS